MTSPTSVLETRRLAADGWHDALRDARDEGYAFFDWLSGVDESEEQEEESEPELPPGIDVLCHLLDVRGRGPGGLRRLLLRTRVPDGGTLDSVTDLFAGAAWHERETHEMFGVDFRGFDDGTGLGLRPLLLPEGFEGSPLRKTFVLGARASKPWPGAKEPGEGSGDAPPKGRRPRKRLLPPGVPDPSWGPRGDRAQPDP
ncbi:NADH-quinone oxidoreductase subunit C [Serinicoccus kebangsaanensis]|uniref:NADH-quinone oxidoreductase subunit C n=1 Tax=Serinicoccus kebangsaanensis TaxID=2602069 RepID=UPI00124EDA63|nr:NADH-quinone oxidoreductase subunit C [Serinicoccus kebangsaanensis]